MLVAEPPRLDLVAAERVARETFGVEGRASGLVSERDQNFAIRTADGSAWVLKISNAAEQLNTIAMENAAIEHVASIAPELPVPRLGRAADGETIAWIEADGRRHLARLVSFVPGQHLVSTELDRGTSANLGAAVAHLGLALRSFFHPAAGRRLQWDVKHALALAPLIPAIADPGERALVERVLERFAAQVAPRLDRLRAQVIHSDLSLDNVLFADDGSVAGIVDFGDLVHTALVADLATAVGAACAGREDGLAAAQWVVRGFERAVTLEPLEWEVLPLLVEARLATSLTVAAWRLERYPENADYITVDCARHRALLELLDSLGPERARLAIAGELAGEAESASLRERRTRVFGPALQGLTYNRPIHMARGEGAWMVDTTGTRFLDVYNNVPVCGHSHPRVVEAATRQARRLNTNMRYLHGTAVELAERLLATMPPEIDTCAFVNSGSEANDLAWRLIAHATGRTGGLVTEYAYHGLSTTLTAFSPEEWRGLEPPSHVVRFPAPDGYRGPIRRETDGWGERYAACLDDSVAELRGRGIEPAAVFVDGALASDGILDPPDVWSREVARRAHAVGARYVADEVQAGHGRSGEHLWSFAACGVVPDAVTLGKPMGNGYPVAAVLFRRELAEAFAEHTIYFSTYGGNPVACAAALATLEVIEEEELQENARVTGAYLRRGLEALAARHEAIGDVRGRGLMVGLELVSDRETRTPDGDAAAAVVNGLRERGVLVSRSGKEANVLKIRPPLVFGREHADLFIDRLDDTLSALARGQRA